MVKYLSKKDRATLLKELTKEQKKILFTVIGKRHRSYFADILAKYKGTRDWTFYRYIDHGSVRKNITCGCGRPLRHQYILINKKTREKRTIGSTHLMEELNIPENIAKEVLQRFHNINYDLDEVLQKYADGWELPPSIKRNLSSITLPNDIQHLLTMDLPLLLRQVDVLYSKISRLKNKKTKTTKMFTKAGSGDSVEIQNEDIYKVLTGKIDSFTYIDAFREDITQFLTNKRHYTPIYDIVNHLVKVGMPFQLMHGQHALTKNITDYLNTRKDIIGKIMDDGYEYYALY